MSCEKKFIEIIKEEQKEKLKDKLEKQRIKDTITTNLTMMIINYFEENFNKKYNRRFEYNNFIYTLKNYYPNIIYVNKYFEVYYKKVPIRAYNIWMKIEKEYVDNFNRETMLSSIKN